MCIFGGGRKKNAGQRAVDDTRPEKPREDARGKAIDKAPKVAAAQLRAMYGGGGGGRNTRSTIVNRRGGAFVPRSDTAIIDATSIVLGG